MSCESYDLRLTTLSPIHIGSGKSYSCCEFVPAKAKSKGQIVKIIKRVNLTNYYSSLSDDRKDTFLASLTNSNFELKQFDKKIKKDFVRYQCIDNSRVDFLVRNIDKIIPIEVGVGKKTKSQLTKAINNYNSDYGILISNRTFSIKKENNIIYIPLRTFSYI